LSAPLWALAQVALIVPGAEFNASVPIPVKIKNDGKQRIAYCVEFGQTPLYAQRRAGSKWSALSAKRADLIKTLKVLAPGESEEFPFQVTSTGEIRLVLDYWIGPAQVNCKHPPKGWKQAQSSTITIH
jgi:hypothetical protein